MSHALTTSPAFVQLLAHKRAEAPCIPKLLQNEGRNERLFVEANDVCMDLSRQYIDEKSLDLLLELAKERELASKIKAMVSGVKINSTEGRSVLHTALRMPESSSLVVEGADVVKDVHAVLKSIRRFSTQIRTGELRGFTGKPLRNLICVGIGGSYLGGDFISEALKTDPTAAKGAEGRTIRFLANVDPIDVERAKSGLNPEETLVCIISKTFTTAETILNARTLRLWIVNHFKSEDAVGAHMCAVSSNLTLTSKFGIDSSRVFGFWDWVGGRYSVTSAVGVLPLSLHYGYDVMAEFLKGCHAMDSHFISAPFEKNLPVLLGLATFYNATVMDTSCVAVLPYCQALHRFAAHIQQLTMESNGKGVDINGVPLDLPTGEIFFGEAGTNGQHSFYQLLHQGRVVPAEFIGFIKSQCPLSVPGEPVCNHDELMSNFFAQPDALAFGKSKETLEAERTKPELVGHKTFSGNRPSAVLLFKECNAYNLGLLLSLYENRTAAEGFLWGLNSFDQWGVELGKVLASGIRTILSDVRNAKKADMSALCGPTKRMLSKYLA